ncbi:NAD-dependent epimerase/dehydratase family protein [Cytobacillus massiliigabonensis]|uniref:NAD-dependent epimerase/dehydratase family protein n=1 Tax=Cytobacillus massiliigabonensis TaxID=1871011 RepID=UPI000C81A37D|nr:NAD-dependent epimerase/dehydratase family protein [Cytobacillus massiliigabonensis]
MKVLITGGYGFIGSFVSEKFYREGHEVHILDNLSTGKKSNVQFRHRSYLLNIEDEQCEEVFRTNKFDVVIHLAAQVDVEKSIQSPASDSKVNVLGLINILQLAGKYKVSKFVFASSAAVYGNNEEIPLNEESACEPFSPYGINKKLGEYYCRKWNEMYQLDTTCFRFSNVYGPKQGNEGEGGVISIFANKILNREELMVYGDGTQTRDFIYVEDVAEAIYRSVMSDVSGLMNLSTNTETSINQLVQYYGELADLPEIVYKPARSGDIKNSRLDNLKIKQEVDWSPKYSLEEGLKRTFDWFAAEITSSIKEKENTDIRNAQVSSKFIQNKDAYFPFIENIILFLIIASLHVKVGDFLFNIDLLLLYILSVGMIFGKVQALIGCGFSVILYSWQGLLNGREIVSLFTDHTTLIQFAVYLFVALLVGYVIDKKHIKEETAKSELQLFKEKYQLLDDIYTETRKVKEELQTQILYSKDSVGEVYSIIKKIDSLEPDDVFNGVISVLEQIMKTKEASIYLVGKGNRYLRLVSKSNVGNSSFPASIEVAPNSPFARAIEENKVFINRELDPKYPMMIAPIWKDDYAVAVICTNEMNFDHLTLYHENLFHVVTSLITASVTRAYEYVNATHHERYIEGTAILKPEYFNRAVESKKKAHEQLNIPYYLLRIVPIENMASVVNQISSSLRDTDCIGVNEDGSYAILLSNTDKDKAKTVINRIQMYINQQHVKEEEVYV